MSFFARTIIVLVGLSVVGFSATTSLAENNVLVFDVRKPISMSKEDKPEKDYYINSGLESGLKRGFLVTVVRRSSLYDAYQNKSPGELVVPVGRLRIVHSQKGLSVGRLHSLFERDNLPVVDYDHIMVGDRLDLDTIASADSAKKKEAKVSAPVDVPKPVEAKSEIKEAEKVAVEGSAEQSSSAPKQEENVNLPTMQ